MPQHIHLHHDETVLKEAIGPKKPNDEPRAEDQAAPQEGPDHSQPAVEPKPAEHESRTGTPEHGDESQTSRIRKQADPETIREQILSEIQEQEALEEFRQTRPDMWVQVMRVGHILELQEEFDEETWPEGSCFLYAGLPGAQSFCVKKILDVDLETCTVAVSIYADEELEAGTILIPLEAISWFGFPKNAVQVGRKRLRGFTAPFLAAETEEDTD